MQPKSFLNALLPPSLLSLVSLGLFLTVGFLCQVLVVATGPEECGMVVPPARELPSQQTPEVQFHFLPVQNCAFTGDERHELFHGG